MAFHTSLFALFALAEPLTAWSKLAELDYLYALEPPDKPSSFLLIQVRGLYAWQ